jgi:DNA gyrase subunit A
MKKKKKIIDNQQSQIIIQPIEKEVQSSYLTYAMSVIVSRALPDIRDGLKPVHRRILYAMWQMGLKANAKYRKSATVIGEVLGKYHPHGDLAVYDALVRMAQDFSLRYPLIDGQGNFGSIDGDSAAAYRYTEVRLSPIAEEMLFDIEKNVVPFTPNYDGTLNEPLVLPAKIPNLLLNGALGIAVGMATNIPPHNLKEVCQAINYLIDHEKAEIDDLIKIIKGPDFPTGGLIFDINQIKDVYVKGQGPIVIRAKTEIVETGSNQYQIIITEIPYQVNKADLIKEIADLVKEKKIEGIKDIKDESDKEGIRVIIDLKRQVQPQQILNQLYKLTDLQTTFHVNLVTLVDGIQPKLVNLKSILEEFIKHRQIVIRKRVEYDLNKIKQRIHILKGFEIVYQHLDEIIQLIKKSKDPKEAKENLISKYKLTEIQANAILEMKLQQLARLERIRIEEELKEKLKQEKELTEILAKPKKILEIIKNEMNELINKYGDERRTQIIPEPVKIFKEEDIIPEEPTIILITKDGYIKRLSPNLFKVQERGGKGVIGLEIKEEDVVEKIISTTTHADLLFFTTKGRLFQTKVYSLPEFSRISKGQALVNFLNLAQNEKVSEILAISLKKEKPKYLIMATANGLVKKISLENIIKVKRSGLKVINLRSNDTLEWVKPTTGEDEIILITTLGQAIRFSEKDLREMSKQAAGVKGINLTKDDKVIGMEIIKRKKPNQKLLIITENGFGKMTLIKEYRLQRRGGSGIKTAKITNKTGKVVAGLLIDEENLPEYAKGDLLVISQLGQVIRFPLKSVKLAKRVTQGVRLMKFLKEDKVASVTLI